MPEQVTMYESLDSLISEISKDVEKANIQDLRPFPQYNDLLTDIVYIKMAIEADDDVMLQESLKSLQDRIVAAKEELMKRIDNRNYGQLFDQLQETVDNYLKDQTPSPSFRP